MARMYPKQAVDIVQKLLTACTEDSASTLFGVLSPKQIQAIRFLVRFVDEVRQAKDLVGVIDRLFEEGAIYTVEDERGGKRKGAKKHDAETRQDAE